MQPAHWPSTIQRLYLHVIKGGESLRLVAEAISNGAFPLLRELGLMDVVLDSIEDAACLGRALMKSGGKLEVFSLRFLRFHEMGVPGFDFVGHMLGLHMEDPLKESFGSLKVLRIDEYYIDWALFGTAILGGRFPRIREITGWMTTLWYQVSVPCTRLWFEVIRCRHVKAFPDKLFFSPVPRTDGWLPLFREFFIGLGLMALQPDLISCIRFLALGVPLDDEACKALSRAMSLGNLRGVRKLEFSINVSSCAYTSMEGFGRVIHPSFIPKLMTVTLSVEKEDDDSIGCLRLWRSFLQGIPVEGRSLFTKLNIGGSDDGGKSPKGICVILEALVGAPSETPIVLSKVTALYLHGEVTVDDLIAMSTALMAGVFPSLVKLHFFGKSRNGSHTLNSPS